MNNGGPNASFLPSNPFSTRYICPDAAAYLFPEGTDTSGVIATLRESDWWGEIVGPHGSGKTTLLHTLVPRMEETGRRVESYVLHQSGRRLVLPRRTRCEWNRETQVVVDGYEQLSWIDRMRIKRACRTRGAGLLVTSHKSVGLPRIWRTGTSLELAQALVDCLLPAEYASWISAEDVANAFSACHGNLREVLMALYDVLEDRAKEAGAKG